MPALYGQAVMGPPGSGKSTYCKAMGEFLKKLGRNVVLVNLDPGNDLLEYQPGVDVSDLITVEDVMTHKKLGPNGGLIYAIEYLQQNFKWLLDQLSQFKNSYFIFDCPGQIELYTHHTSMKSIFEQLQNSGFHLCSVFLIDSHNCSDPGKFIAALLVVLTTMLNIALPHVSILSKADMLKKFSHKLRFPIEYYTDVLDLNYILDQFEETSNQTAVSKYKKFNTSIVDLLSGFSLVSFVLLDVKDERMLLNVKNNFDKANGYIYNAGEQTHVQTLLACAVGAQTESERIGSHRDMLMNDAIHDTMEQ